MLKLATVLLVSTCVVGQTDAAGDDSVPVTAKKADNKPKENSKKPESVSTDEYYDRETVQKVHLEISDDNLAKMKAALPKRIYVPGTFRWRDQTIKKVGVRYKGNSSSNPNQPFKRSYLVKFNEFKKKRKFLGLERVSFDNGIQFGSLFSEQLITEILHDLKIPVQRCNFAKLYLNGEFHGVFVNVERIDNAFLKRNFADANGALYKVDEGGAGCNLAPVPKQPGGQGRPKHAFEPKSKAAGASANDVFELITKINETPKEKFAEMLEANMHVDTFLQTMAVMLCAGAFDQLTGWGPHNYYLYHEPNGRWHYVPWDLDVGFADKAFRRVPVIDGWNAAWPIPGGPPRPLIERIVDDPKLLARYRQFADLILERYFHPNVLIPKLDALYARVKDGLANDPFPHKRVTNPEDQGYEAIVESMRAFINRRYELARAQLDKPGERPKIQRTPQGGPQPGKPSKDAPTELTVLQATKLSVILSWKINSKGAAGFVLQRADGEKDGKFHNLIGQPGANISKAADSKIVLGRTYRYRVYAVRATPMGPKGTGVSNVVTVRVPAK